MSKWHRAWTVLQWVLIPLLVFGSVEAVLRKQLASSADWYRDNVSSDGSRQVLFVGTSRTRSAIDEPAFLECLPAESNPARVINLGMGNSTQAIHLHALRDRVWANPMALRETTVFVETTQGLPSFYFPEEFFWKHVRHETMPWRWHLYLDSGTVLDLRFFASANLDFEGRLKLASRMMTRDLFLFGKREIVGLRWRGIAHAAAKKLFNGRERDTPQHERIDLRGGGGIRTDAEGVEAMGDFERQMVKALDAFDADLPSPEKTPAGALIDFALKHGAEVVCFSVPTHSSKRRGFAKSNMQRHSRAFNAFLKDRDVPLVEPAFVSSDEDFPDRSHLAGSRAKEYTRKLYEAWKGGSSAAKSEIDATR